jgi:uroporphyrinogen III methyltransferase/synthase
VVVTRSVDKAGSLSRLLEELGADVRLLPMIRTEPAWDPHEVKSAIADGPEWLAFTSASGVEQWFASVQSVATPPLPCRVAAVGRSTSAALAAYGVTPEIVPTRATSSDLASALLPHLRPGAKVLWPKGNLADGSWAERLQQAGVHLTALTVYRTLPETGDPGGSRAFLEANGADWITFTSASTVKGWHALGLHLPRPARIASIGPSTSAHLRKLDYPVDAESSTPSLEALAAAIVQAERSHVPNMRHHAP